MSDNTVLVGAKAPENIKITVYQGDTDLDLTTVTAVQMRVIHADRTQSIWACTFAALGPDPNFPELGSSLTATHVFAADGSDVAVVEALSVVVEMTVPSGVRRAGPGQLLVRSLEFNPDTDA